MCAHLATSVPPPLCSCIILCVYRTQKQKLCLSSSLSIPVCYSSLSLSDTYILRLVIRLSDCLSVNRVHACKYTLTIRDVVKRRVYVVCLHVVVYTRALVVVCERVADIINETNV